MERCVRIERTRGRVCALGPTPTPPHTLPTLMRTQTHLIYVTSTQSIHAPILTFTMINYPYQTYITSGEGSRTQPRRRPKLQENIAVNMSSHLNERLVYRRYLGARRHLGARGIRSCTIYDTQGVEWLMDDSLEHKETHEKYEKRVRRRNIGGPEGEFDVKIQGPRPLEFFRRNFNPNSAAARNRNGKGTRPTDTKLNKRWRRLVLAAAPSKNS